MDTWNAAQLTGEPNLEPRLEHFLKRCIIIVNREFHANRKLGKILTSPDHVAVQETSPTVLIGLFLLAFAALAIPFLLTEYIPLTDYPNHLARHYIISAIDHSEHLQAYYSLDWKLIPYLGVDIVSSALNTIAGPHLSERLLYVICALLFLGAASILGRVLHNRFNWLSLSACLVFFSTALSSGLIIFLISTTVATFLFALWIIARHEVWGLQLVLAVLSLSLVYSFHILAFGILVLLILSYEIGKTFTEDSAGLKSCRYYILAVAAALPAMHFAYLVGTGSNDYDTGANLFDGNTIYDKITAIYSPFAQGYVPIDTAIAGVCIYSLIVGVRSGYVQVHADMRIPLVTLAVISILMPAELLGVNGMHVRVPVALSLIACASCRLNTGDKRIQISVAALIAALMVARIATILQTWHSHSLEVSEFVSAVKQMPDGPTVLPVGAPPCSESLCGQ